MTQEKSSEKRRYVRFPILKDLAKPVDLFFESSTTPVPGVLLDLSAGGMGILTFVPVEIGTKVTATIGMPGLNIKNVEGKVIWTLTKGDSWRVGIAFTQIEKGDFEKIKKISEDFADCEIKLSLGVTDVCFSKCAYFSLCTKSVKLTGTNAEN